MGGPTDFVLQDFPPGGDRVTDYDLACADRYLRLLAADAEGANWEEAASLVLLLDCNEDPTKAYRIHGAHLERARWIARSGFIDLLKRGKCDEPRKHDTA